MSRPRSVTEDALITRLARVFGEVGYEGASLTLLSQATGLQKASLYHRFPRGKRQMAEEVLVGTSGWITSHVLQPLAGPGTPADRLAIVATNLDQLYAGGTKACLLNMLSSPRIEDGPFGPAIRDAFTALVGGFAGLAEQTGANPVAARQRAERVMMLLHGSLVLARGLGSTRPFRSFLDALPHELLTQE